MGAGQTILFRPSCGRFHDLGTVPSYKNKWAGTFCPEDRHEGRTARTPRRHTLTIALLPRDRLMAFAGVTLAAVVAVPG